MKNISKKIKNAWDEGCFYFNVLSKNGSRKLNVFKNFLVQVQMAWKVKNKLENISLELWMFSFDESFDKNLKCSQALSNLQGKAKHFLKLFYPKKFSHFLLTKIFPEITFVLILNLVEDDQNRDVEIPQKLYLLTLGIILRNYHNFVRKKKKWKRLRFSEYFFILLMNELRSRIQKMRFHHKRKWENFPANNDCHKYEMIQFSWGNLSHYYRFICKSCLCFFILADFICFSTLILWTFKRFKGNSKKLHHVSSLSHVDPSPQRQKTLIDPMKERRQKASRSLSASVNINSGRPKDLLTHAT